MWSSGEDIIHSGGPGEEKRVALANGGNSEVRVSDSVWALPDESASLDFSLVSGCGSAAGLWLLGFSTVPGFLQQPLFGGVGVAIGLLGFALPGGHTPAIKAAGLEATSPGPLAPR